MITDYEKIFALKQPWPPNDADTQARLNLYAKNDLLFKGRHNAVWEDALRRLRGDKKGDLRVILNFHKILSRLWADLVCGEIPIASSPDATQDLTLKRIITDNMLWIGVQDGIHDFSKYGTNVRKIRFLKRGIIENVPPKYWFPIVSLQNIKEIKAHVIAYVIDTDNKTSYLKVEIHRPPLLGASADGIPDEPSSFVIEHRLYLLKKGKIDSGPLPLGTLAEFVSLLPVEDTKLNDFDIINIENIPPTDELHGIDDYSDINSIVRELEMRYAQILGIEDKFSDPWMYGPPIEEQDPRDGEYRVMGGSRYISLMEGQAPPGMITWPADLPANFQVIDSLMQRLYEISETCKVAFDASQAGSALSGTALRLMMSRPLSKAARIKLRYDAALKKEAYLCSQIEVNHGMDGATEITDCKIEWKDGLPDDPMEGAQIDSVLINSKARSSEGRMRDHGFSKDQILQEQNEMMDQVL